MTTLTAWLRRGLLSAAAASGTTRATRHPASSLPVSTGGHIRFEGVSKRYASSTGVVEALAGIDLEIPAGSIFGIIGRSGAGKSSLLRTINGLESPSAGRVRVDGEDLAALDDDGRVALRRRIGMIFQHFNLLAAKTVHQNVALPLKVAGVPRDAIARRVDEVLALVGLQDRRDSYPRRLSGGQKQRVGIARALVHRPEILLCDEATSALDPETTQSILQLLRDINQRLGITIVLITHEMRVIREICDQVVVLERGAIAEAGPVWQILGEPRHPATRALLAPLTPGIPDDIAARLQPTPPTGGARHIVELHHAGEAGPPGLEALTAALGADVHLLHASLDRIQGHTQGRMLLSIPHTVAGNRPLPQTFRTLGYVADTH